MTHSAPSLPSDSSLAKISADPHLLRPTALEIASGRVYGEYHESGGLGQGDDRVLTPLAALEAVILPALQRPPCLVSFSGGRDSSSVLAAATRAARREGLASPVPITLRVPNSRLAEESEWQERIVRHLGLRDWEVRQVGDEMDRLGPFSTAVLRRHGVLYPPNAFLQLPLLEAARGGQLLTGFGGDEVFSTWRWRYHADLLAGRRRPTPRDILRLAYAASPGVVRRRREHRRWRWGEDLSWLRPEPTQIAAELVFAAHLEQPRSWPRWVDWLMRRRTLSAARWSLSQLAADVGAVLLHPLLDPAFLAAVAKTGGRLGFGDRTAAMRAIFAEALPDASLSLPTKANYDEAFWGCRSREFAARWGGGGVDGELVDPAALRREWLTPKPHGGSAMLLHAAWLSEQS
jgi:hypothetical protein